MVRALQNQQLYLFNHLVHDAGRGASRRRDIQARRKGQGDVCGEFTTGSTPQMGSNSSDACANRLCMQVEGGTCYMTYNKNAEVSIAHKYVSSSKLFQLLSAHTSSLS